MNDTDMLDWLHLHMTSYRCVATDFAGKAVYELAYLDRDGVTHLTRGLDIRDCVRGAIKTFYAGTLC